MQQKFLPSEVKKYLERFSLNKWTLFTEPTKLFKNIIVVPCLDEYENVPQLLNSLSKNKECILSDTLVIIVINNSENANNQIKENNLKTFNYLVENYSKNSLKLQIGIVDAFSQEKQFDAKTAGVGLARKIGMDISLKYFDYHNTKKNILICLDADCEVSQNYLETIVNNFNKDNLHAAYVNFEHPLNNSEIINRAIIAYEIFLRYYVLGLKYSNSPFAFHSIGSTMMCDYSAYIKVQGMNKRKAAEDFYFMEKLSKIYPIKMIDSAKVFPSARPSYRVPFGTGQRINRFLAGSHNDYELYSPEIFDILKKWNDVFYSEEDFNPENIMKESKKIHLQLFVFFNELKFFEHFKRIAENCSNKNQLQIQKKLWFDAFRTLKLVHFLRDSAFPNINMFQALDEMFAKMGINHPKHNADKILNDINAQKEYLNLLRLHA